MNIASSNLRRICFAHKLVFVLTFRTIYECGLVDAKIRASDKDLPVRILSLVRNGMEIGTACFSYKGKFLVRNTQTCTLFQEEEKTLANCFFILTYLRKLLYNSELLLVNFYQTLGQKKI